MGCGVGSGTTAFVIGWSTVQGGMHWPTPLAPRLLCRRERGSLSDDGAHGSPLVGATEQEALGVVAAQASECEQLLFGLDALGHWPESMVVAMPALTVQTTALSIQVERILDTCTDTLS
jgi:hypothetical protein